MNMLSKEEQDFILNYDSSIYEKPSVTVDNLIFRVFNGKLQVLLIRRKEFPYKDKWALPGGFVNINESIKSAAYRKLKEKTGVDKVYLEQLYTFGDVDRDPRMRVVSVAYFSLISPLDIKELKAGEDAYEASFFSIEHENKDIYLTNETSNEKLLIEDLAFDHEKILKLALDRMSGKVMYTDIAFYLLRDKEKFTIFELKNIYELLLNKKLDLPNFRKFFIREYVNSNKVVEYKKVKSTSNRMCMSYKVINLEGDK